MKYSNISKNQLKLKPKKNFKNDFSNLCQNPLTMWKESKQSANLRYENMCSPEDTPDKNVSKIKII